MQVWTLFYRDRLSRICMMSEVVLSSASRPDGPWQPFDFIAARLFSEPLLFSKIVGGYGKSPSFRSVTTYFGSAL